MCNADHVRAMQTARADVVVAKRCVDAGIDEMLQPMLTAARGPVDKICSNGFR